MKKIVLLFISLVVLQLSANADNDKPIKFEQLPTQSQQFIQKYFPGQSIALVKMEQDLSGKSYEVIFTNGNKAEFDRKGAWKEINCKYTELPLQLVPQKITDYVKANYQEIKITKIERKSRNRHDIDLSNGIELLFDANYQLIDIDN